MKAKISILKQEGELEISDKEAQNFLDILVPDFVKQFGGILGNQVKFWRFKNALNIATKANDLVKQSKLVINKIPLKILSPLLENASLEEDKTMQDKWSAMLASAATGKFNISPAYVEILKELSSLEVKILDLIFDDAAKTTSYKERRKLQYDKKKVAEHFSLDEQVADLIIENLYRLNLLQAPEGKSIAVGDYGFVLRTTDIFELTTLGFNFIMACKFNV